jgi:hypothetical protein
VQPVRQFVKDRLEQTGMRWTVNGAQAMLCLRAIHLRDRIETEQIRRSAA